MKKSLKYLLIAFTFQSLTCGVYSQNSPHAFERLTINDGLSNNSINSVLQTSDGYLWIATKDG
ncbi:MAG: hypothetical protein KKG93_07560, partial [Bacteroidetes bacterium]|nr:hypothetical protein [Bacteroidota bacterium]